MKQKILIIADDINFETIDTLLVDECDLLAITPFAMAACERAGRKFLTYDDFYHYRLYRRNMMELISDAEDLLTRLDRKYAEHLDYSRTVSGNICQFMNFFLNVHFMNGICEAVASRYPEVYLAANAVYASRVGKRMAFNFKGMLFSPYASGLHAKVDMLRQGLNIRQCFWDRRRLPYGKRKKFLSGRKIVNYVKKIPQNLYQKRYAWEDSLKRTSGAPLEVIVTVQGGYEVELLKKELRDFVYMDPIKEAFHEPLVESTAKVIPKVYENELEQFEGKWFPRLSGQAEELFCEYHNRIVPYLESALANIQNRYSENNPKAVFFATYAFTVLEDLYAYCANQKDIPVFYFQHGGTRVFHFQENQTYQEQNKRIEKINIFNSSVERQLSQRDVSPLSQALGSIKLYDFSQKGKKTPPPGKKRILYCGGGYPSWTFKDYSHNISDYGLVQVQEEIFSAAAEWKLEMDIKAHPINEEEVRYYLRERIRKLGPSLKIIKGRKIEEIIFNYDLIICDYIGSAIIPLLSVLNVPIILYLKDQSFLREEVLPDLHKRFYLVQDKEAYTQVLRRFQEGKLEAKYSEDFVNKYAFPIEDGDPAVNIANYIRECLNSPQGKLNQYSQVN